MIFKVVIEVPSENYPSGVKEETYLMKAENTMQVIGYVNETLNGVVTELISLLDIDNIITIPAGIYNLVKKGG